MTTKHILCVQQNWIYPSAEAAAKGTKLKKSAVYRACLINDPQWTIRGLSFFYVTLPPGPLLPTMTEPTPVTLKPYRKPQGRRPAPPKPYTPKIDMTKPGWRSRLIKAGIERPGHRMRRRPRKPARPTNDNPGN